MAQATFNPNYDGHVTMTLYSEPELVPTVYGRNTTGTSINCGEDTPLDDPNTEPDVYYRGFWDFNTSLPSGATVTKIEMGLSCTAVELDGSATLDNGLTKMTSKAQDVASDATLFSNIGNTSYVTFTPSAGGGIVYRDLGATAITDFNGHPTWFSVGMNFSEYNPAENNQDNYSVWESNENTNKPVLRITYTLPASGEQVAHSGGGSHVI